MKRERSDVAFEDSLGDDWSRDLQVAEVPLGNRPLLYLGIGIALVVCAVLVQIIYLNWAGGAYYKARAEDNMTQYAEVPAPRGTIYDRAGGVLAESKAAFAAILDVHIYLTQPTLASATDDAAEHALGLPPGTVAALVEQASVNDFATPIVLAENLTQAQLVNLQALALPTIKIQNDFVRDYPNGPMFASVVGYTGRTGKNDLASRPGLSATDFIGKSGVEAYYDSTLQGAPGVTVQYRDARGDLLRAEQISKPMVGTPLHLTIDGGLQTYLYGRLASGLRSLGRHVGLALAMDPRTGEVLSLVNLPGFDNNLFSKNATGTGAALQDLFTSSDKPLFDRIVNGFYNPGSTIKPLDGVAALKEGVIDPNRTIFSNGFLLVPNRYNSSTPSKYLDWRYQGSVNLASALAQSSDVYFYEVVGGSPAYSTPPLNDPSDYGISGLGITKIYSWWQRFGLGKPTGIDMPGESSGFLPTPDWKQTHLGTPWLLGDTYNVAIGQGDLLLTPLQLLNYIDAIANGGAIYRPFLNTSSTPQVREDLTDLLPQIKEVQKGMEMGVSSPQGTSYTLHDLPVCVAAKTGSAQVMNNQQENALFVGYAPCNDPKFALLLLIENSREGSLNAVPIARDVMNWYYLNRL